MADEREQALRDALLAAPNKEEARQLERFYTAEGDRLTKGFRTAELAGSIPASVAALYYGSQAANRQTAAEAAYQAESETPSPKTQRAATVASDEARTTEIAKYPLGGPNPDSVPELENMASRVRGELNRDWNGTRVDPRRAALATVPDWEESPEDVALPTHPPEPPTAWEQSVADMSRDDLKAEARTIGDRLAQLEEEFKAGSAAFHAKLNAAGSFAEKATVAKMAAQYAGKMRALIGAAMKETAKEVAAPVTAAVGIPLALLGEMSEAGDKAEAFRQLAFNKQKPGPLVATDLGEGYGFLLEHPAVAEHLYGQGILSHELYGTLQGDPRGETQRQDYVSRQDADRARALAVPEKARKLYEERSI